MQKCQSKTICIYTFSLFHIFTRFTRHDFQSHGMLLLSQYRTVLFAAVFTYRSTSGGHTLHNFSTGRIVNNSVWSTNYFSQPNTREKASEITEDHMQNWTSVETNCSFSWWWWCFLFLLPVLSFTLKGKKVTTTFYRLKLSSWITELYSC